MKIALAQINSKLAAFSENRDKIVFYSQKAATLGAEIVLFPELSICGYPPMDLLDYKNFVNMNIKTLREIQKNSPKKIAIILGHVDKNPISAGKLLLNQVSAIYNGEIIFSQAKTLLPTYDVFDETRYFEAAKKQDIFNFNGLKIGLTICEDIWLESEHTHESRYAVDPVRTLINLGADIILSSSASPYYTGKIQLRKKLLSEIGSVHGLPCVYANCVGANDSLIFDGHSFVTNSKGEVTHMAKGYEEDLLFVETDNLDACPPLTIGEEKYEEVERALVLGIQDYMQKCGFEKAHIASSGGIDSALVIYLAVKAIGAENVKTFALPSRYSSAGSKTDAVQLAKNLGVTYEEFSIEEIFSSTLNTLQPLFKDLSQDVTEENIQARIRGLLMMAYSNKMHSLLLTTGNKSELATGYATLYGDMCGGLAVIGDLFKTEVFDLCEYINRKHEIIPASILTKAPSAELRADQKDEDSLPPYPVLDAILKQYLVNYKTAKEIAEAGYDLDLVRQILRLVGINEHKRRQAPPVLKVSTRAFGNGRRLPIARSFFET